MKRFFIAGFMLAANILSAQDLFQETLFSTDLIFDNREKISLTQEQSERIRKIMEQQTSEFGKMKQELNIQNARLKTLLVEVRPDTKAAQKQLDAVLAVENAMKKTQIATLIAIKNELTESQHKLLQGIKAVGAPEPPVISQNNVPSAEQKVKLTLGGDSKQPPIMYQATRNGFIKIDDISKVDPDDISSIEVVKGKNALERFGVEGANGVVIIKFKNH
jgi:hypothetical protein